MDHCAKCGRALPAQGEFCPACGAPRSAVQPGLAAHQKSAVQPKTRFGLSRWDFAALAGGAVSAGVWYFWSTLDRSAPPDGFTPFYIIGFTAAVVFLRKPFDRLLAPLQAFKRHIPRLVLIGVALALPYFLAHFFYSQGITNYPLMHNSIVGGTILPYVLLRIPENWQSGARKGLIQGTGTHAWIFLLIMAAGFFAGAYPVFADDFTRDFTRLQDGMRTPGWAESIAGTAATAINVLVNGALVFQQSGKSGENGQDAPQYTMDVRTENERTSLVTDDKDRLWIYGKLTCVKGAVQTDLTDTISFSFSGQYTDWVSIRQTASTGGYKAVLLGAKPPSQDAKLQDGANVLVTVSGTTNEGELIDGPVTIDLEDELKLKVTILA